MAILEWPDPILSERAEPVQAWEFGTESLTKIIGDMIPYVGPNTGGIGLAAPQIGVLKRIIVWHANANFSGHMINPVIHPKHKGKFDVVERCLSCPELKYVMRRYKAVRMTGFNVNGEPISVSAKLIHAAIFQHELDHLNGITIAGRLDDKARAQYGVDVINELRKTGGLTAMQTIQARDECDALWKNGQAVEPKIVANRLRANWSDV